MKSRMLKFFRKKKPIKPTCEAPLPGQQLYSLAQAAVYLGRSVYSVRTLIWKGSLPVVADGRKQWIDIKDLKHFVEVNKRIVQ